MKNLKGIPLVWQPLPAYINTETGWIITKPVGQTGWQAVDPANYQPEAQPFDSDEAAAGYADGEDYEGGEEKMMRSKKDGDWWDQPLDTTGWTQVNSNLWTHVDGWQLEYREENPDRPDKHSVLHKEFDPTFEMFFEGPEDAFHYVSLQTGKSMNAIITNKFGKTFKGTIVKQLKSKQGHYVEMKCTDGKMVHWKSWEGGNIKISVMPAIPYSQNDIDTIQQYGWRLGYISPYEFNATSPDGHWTISRESGKVDLGPDPWDLSSRDINTTDQHFPTLEAALDAAKSWKGKKIQTENQPKISQWTGSEARLLFPRSDGSSLAMGVNGTPSSLGLNGMKISSQAQKTQSPLFNLNLPLFKR